MKCEVLSNCVIAIEKGSVVIVSEKQYELARKVLKPIENKKSEKVEDVKDIETATLPKTKNVRKR